MWEVLLIYYFLGFIELVDLGGKRREGDFKDSVLSFVVCFGSE